jgi:hypothetical protein
LSLKNLIIPLCIALCAALVVVELFSAVFALANLHRHRMIQFW